MGITLKDKTALVTGASRGIGEAIARIFCESGAKVMLVSRKEESLKEVSKSLGDNADYFAANVSDIEAMGNAVSKTISRFGSLDILVNNAATNPYFGPMIEIDTSKAHKTLEVNLHSILRITQLCFEAWMKQHGGNIINISSVGGLSVEWGIGYYNVTKAALIHLTKQLAGELGPAIRVNAIAPGLVKTYFAKVLWENFGDQVAKRLPLKRIGEPIDIAKAALFLASDMSDWITGHTLVVDGGATVTPSGGVV